MGFVMVAEKYPILEPRTWGEFAANYPVMHMLRPTEREECRACKGLGYLAKVHWTVALTAPQIDNTERVRYELQEVGFRGTTKRYWVNEDRREDFERLLQLFNTRLADYDQRIIKEILLFVRLELLQAGMDEAGQMIVDRLEWKLLHMEPK